MEDLRHIIPGFQADVVEECEDAIKEELWTWAKPKFLRKVIKFIPQWYKERLQAQHVATLGVAG